MASKYYRKKIALKLHNNHFCLIWKSEGVSFNQAVKEMKYNFKLVDNFITKKMLFPNSNMKSFQKK